MAKEIRKILIWGGRSKARIIIAMISEIYGSSAEITAIFDKTLSSLQFNTDIKLYTQNSDLTNLCKNSTHFVVCTGGEHGYARYMISRKFQERGLKPLSLISKYSILDNLEDIGSGIQVMPGAVAHKFSRLGEQCILNTNSTIDHDCIIGDGVHVMGSASIAGCVKIGDFSTIGTNATILPNIEIGENVYIGAGAVVTDNVKSGEVVIGVPAKFLRYFLPSIDLSPFS